MCFEKLKVLCLPTHFISSNGKWVSIADEQVDPILNSNKHSLSIQIHPYDAENG